MEAKLVNSPDETAFPPVYDGLVYLFLSREPHDDYITVYLPNGDSYDLLSDQLERYLLMLNCPTPWRVVSYVWNFYSAVYDCGTGGIRWVPKEDIENRDSLLGMVVPVMETVKGTFTSE